VLIALLFLTVTTVLTAKFVDLGSMNFFLAMGIAIVKGTLVFAFFMHLFWDKLINTVIIVATLFAAALFIGISVTDLTARHHIDRQESGEVVMGGLATPVQNAIDSGHAAHNDAEHHEAEGDEHAEEAAHTEDNHAEPDHAEHDHSDH